MLDEPLKVVWTAAASAALEQIHRYIAEDNPSAANDLIDDIHERVYQLSTLPDLGFKSRVRRSLGLIRELIVGNYRVIYQPELELKRILILLVWHSARRNPKAKDFEPS